MKEPREPEDLRVVMMRCLISCVESGLNVAVLVSDSTSTAAVGPFASRFPDRVVNVGIAEQNLMGVAAGMALGGYVAVTANAAAFAVHRANEQLKNDICYSETNVKVVGLNAGFAYGSLGSTHHAIDDISAVLGFGVIRVFAPADPLECEQVVAHAMRTPGPVYIRLDSAKFPAIHEPGYEFRPGAIDILSRGEEAIVFSMGSVTCEALAAVTALKAEGWSVGLVNLPSLRPLDIEALAEEASRSRILVTVEEHSRHGGIGSIVSEVVAEKGIGARVIRLGVPEAEFAKAGPRAELRRCYAIDASGIAATVRAAMANPRG
jgi:transketolase